MHSNIISWINHYVETSVAGSSGFSAYTQWEYAYKEALKEFNCSIDRDKFEEEWMEAMDELAPECDNCGWYCFQGDVEWNDKADANICYQCAQYDFAEDE